MIFKKRNRTTIEFSDLDDLCVKLNVDKNDLKSDDNYVLLMSEEERHWRCLGSTDTDLGLPIWRGPFYKITPVKSVWGWGVPDFIPEPTGESFEIRGDEIKWYSTKAGQLKDGREFVFFGAYDGR